MGNQIHSLFEYTFGPLQATAAAQRPSLRPPTLSSTSPAAYLQQTIAKSIENIGFFGARVTEVEKLGQICGML